MYDGADGVYSSVSIHKFELQRRHWSVQQFTDVLNFAVVIFNMKMSNELQQTQ